MARIKKYSPEQKLSSFQTFIVDENPNSEYFRITEFKDTFTGGKNGFLIEGSEYLKESTEIKIELLDVNGDPIYYEPGNGIPEYYEGISKLVAVYIYNDTPIGLGKITILGELKDYNENGVKRQVPDEWKGAYNVKWERTFQVNKLLANEDKVRFYRRPDVTIDEIVKPIFSGNPPSVTQTGSLDGIPLVPIAGTNLSNFTIPTSYRLKVNSGNKWTGSIEGQTISFDNITYSPTIDEIVNENEIIVSPPYSENNIVASFTNEDYSLTFPYIEGVSDLATALTGSFAKISITDMKTFVGDAARVKVFRRSQSNLTDYEFVQEIQLESNEVLRDITTFAKKEEPYGFFTQQVIDDYWITSSNDINVTFNQNFLYNSAKLDSSPNNYFITSQSFSIQNGVEYTLDFNARLSGSIVSGDYLKVFLSGSNNGSGVSQTITTINASNGVLQKTNFSENIIADTFDSAKLYFEVSGSDWYVNNVSLKASQETSFSPDEITFIQQVPKTLVEETFDYRFEFYDINNNFIPVRVEKTKTFVGGNTNLFEKSLEITPDNLYFSFDSASNPANPIPPLVVNLDVETNLVTGSITYTSGAYDFRGNLLSSSQYVGGQYPGYLTDWDVDGGRQPFLRVQDFTGSRDDITVQFIRYTGAVEGVSDTFVITRVEDGKGGVSFEIVPFRGLQIKNKESKTLEIQAVRVDGINRINLQSGLERGFSDAKLHVLSSSLDGTQTYVSLSQAITNPNFLEGVSAGETGSGEIDYNAIFTRDAIDNELTIYLMDGPTSESILTSEILTDLKDGLNNGIVSSTTEQFNIKYKPREVSQFDPLQSIVTASFQRRGTTLNPLSASLVIKPSSSIQPLTELPQYYMFYETGAFDDTITVAVTDFGGNLINSGIPGDSVPYYTATPTKQLNLEFTYTEPITSASVTANKSFFITPDGLPGQDAITIDIDPNPIALGSNHKGEVYNYSLADTNIQVSQGDYFLINTASGNPGTFTTTSIVTNNIVYGTLDGDSTTTMSLAGFETMSALSASVQYNFDIYPYFTASLVTASRIQKFTKVVEGGGAIEVTLDPIAVALNADEGGFVSDYTKASTEVFIKQNDDFFFYDESNSGRPGTFVTASVSASNISFSELSSSFRDLSVSGSVLSSGGEILHFKGFGGLERNQPSASVTYNFKVYPYSLKAGVAGVPRIVSKTQTFSKVNDGTAARKVSLTTSADTIVYNGDGTKISPEGTVTLTATAFNTTGSAYFKFLDDEGGTIQVSSTDNTLNNLSPLPGTGSIRTYTVELRDGNPNGALVDTDSVSISGIKEGSTAYSVQLSNPASSVTVEVDGTIYFDNSNTLIRAYKGGTELQYVEEYDEQTLDPITFLPIGTFGQFSASVHDISTFLTQGTLRDGREIVSSSGDLYASASGISDWNLPQDNTQGFIIYKIDFENGRGTQFIQQSFSTVFEGATGPGLVFRGPYTGSIEYIFNLQQKRRDAVLYSANGSEPYDTYYATKESGSTYTIPAGTQPPTVGGVLNSDYWESLGQEEFFVAAKLAIFEQSFVKETINVGTPPDAYPNANIAIVGGTDEPYIAIGQQGTQGFRQPGVFLGMTNDGGALGTQGTFGIMSLKSTPDVDGKYKSMEWDGETLIIRGAIRQTGEGEVETRVFGLWDDLADGFGFLLGDVVSNNGITWKCIQAHDKGTPPYPTSTYPAEPGTGGSYTSYWEESDLAAQTLRLSATGQSFVEGTNGVLTPDFIEFTANKENIGTVTSWTSSPSVTFYDGFFAASPTTTGDTVYLLKADFGTNTAVTVTATAGGKSDEITVVRLTDGSNSITSVLTNESHTLQANVGGVVSDFSDSGTDIQAYEGATSLTFQKPTSLSTNTNFEAICQSSITAGDTDMIFVEADIQSNTAGDIEFWKVLADAGLLWVYDVNSETSFYNGTSEVRSAKIAGLTNTSGTTWRVDFADGYEISSTADANAFIQFDFEAFDGNTNFQILSGSGNTLSNSEFTIEAATYKGFTGAQFPTLGGDGTTIGVVSDLTNFSSALNNGFINYVLKHKKANGDIVRVVKKQSFTKAVEGASGTSGTAGASGAPGAGVTYRGEWANDAGVTYNSSDTRKDVVEYNSTYYLAIYDGADTFAGNIIPTNTNYWETFGAQFESVATDILFSQDVYANRTVNVGTGTNGNPVIALNADAANNYASPYISIGQATQSFEEEGIFLGFPSQSSAPVMSLVSGSDFFIYNDGVIALSNASLQGTGSTITGPSIKVGYISGSSFGINDFRSYNFTVDSDGIVSASEAFIQGTVQANAGKIGEWIITDPEVDGQGNQIGGILRDSDGEIRFNPHVGEIQIYSASYTPESVESATTMSVTSAAGAFYIDRFTSGSERAPVVHLERSIYNAISTPGEVQNAGYYFDLSDSSLSGHQFSFSMRENGTGTYGGRYNTSTTLDTSETGQNFLIITSSADPGTAGAYIQITPSASMTLPFVGNGLIGDPGGMSFYYYCENHTGMGNRVYIYDFGEAVELTPSYIERVTVGTQNEFTDPSGAGGSFTFSGTYQNFYNLLVGVNTTDTYGSPDIATTDIYSANSNAVTLDKGDVTITDISYPTITMNSSGIPNADFTSNEPNYQPSYEGQVHGGTGIMDIFPSRGYRQITVYFQLIDSNGDVVSSRYLYGKTNYGASDAYGIWTAVDSGGFFSVVGTTEITLSDGTKKLAKDITLNDKILSWDSENEKWVSTQLGGIKKRDVNEVYKVSVGGKEIEVSKSHGFWLFGNEENSGQIRVPNIVEGETEIWIKDGNSKKKVIVDKVERIERKEEVVTFTVPKYVNYVSNDIISHNYYGSFLVWDYEQWGSAQAATSAGSVSSGTKTHTATIPVQGDYRARFKMIISSRTSLDKGIGTSSSSTFYSNVNSAFNTTFDSDNSGANIYLNGGYSMYQFNTELGIQRNNNFIEVIPAGIQVVSGTGRYSRINRRDQDDNTPELIEVVDGSIKVESRSEVSQGTSFNDKLAIYADGDIMPITTANTNPSTTGWQIGGSANYWREGWFRELNGTPIGTMQLVAACYFGVSTTGTIQGPYNAHNVSGVTRAQKGRFTVSITNTTGFDLSAALGFANGYGRNGATDNGPGTNIGDAEFTFNNAVKVKSTNVEINVKDNNNDADRDPRYVYFVLFSD